MKITFHNIDELRAFQDLLLDGVDILKELQKMAKNITDIGMSIGELRTAITTEHQEVTAELAKMQLKIDELKLLVEAGGTQEQIEAVLAEIQTAKDDVAGIVTPTDGGGGEVPPSARG